MTRAENGNSRSLLPSPTERPTSLRSLHTPGRFAPLRGPLHRGRYPCPCAHPTSPERGQVLGSTNPRLVLCGFGPDDLRRPVQYPDSSPIRPLSALRRCTNPYLGGSCVITRVTQALSSLSVYRGES